MKRNKLLKTIHYALLAIVFISALFLPKFILAENLEEICQLEKIEEQCGKLEPAEYRNLLEKCEEYYRKQSEEIEKDISKTGAEKKTLENKIYTLNKQIKNLDYQIYQSNLIVKDLGIQVEDTGTSIEKNSLKIEDSKEKLSNILRTIYEEDQKPIIEVLFSEDELSDFFDNLIALELLDSKSKEFLQNIKTLKLNLEQQKQSLDEEKDDLEHMVKIQTIQIKDSAETKKEQEYYLKITDTQYQKQLQEQQEVEAKAAKIRTRLFELIGISKAPTFGEAYELAKYVEGITGVRPAFLLAILTQESNIGKNVGQCYLSNANTGQGVSIKTGQKINKVMRPGPPHSITKDVPHFMEIIAALGRDPFATPVSCPMSVGWGGAMGPAQFMPTTWAKYKDRISTITGKPSDPWNIRDAFLASGLYLSDYGAKSKEKNGEWKAAMIYFSGSTKNSAFYWYADNVLKIATGFENDIKILEQNP